MHMSYADIVSSFALVLAIIDLILHFFFSRKTAAPAINYEFQDLPPYMADDETTTVIVANDGTARAKIKKIAMDFSWNEDLQIVLYDMISNQKLGPYLNPNEHWSFEKRLPEPNERAMGFITIRTTYDRNSVKEDRFSVKGHQGYFL